MRRDDSRRPAVRGRRRHRVLLGVERALLFVRLVEDARICVWVAGLDPGHGRKLLAPPVTAKSRWRTLPSPFRFRHASQQSDVGRGSRPKNGDWLGVEKFVATVALIGIVIVV